MKIRLSLCLAVLALLLLLWPLAPARAQVLQGTFAAGFSHSLSIHADGTLWAVGNNMYGQLGDGTSTDRSSWVQIGTATNWKQALAGEGVSLALRTDGSLWAWGNNFFGILTTTTGNNQFTSTPTPQPLAGTWAQVAIGGRGCLALKADGSLWAWGDNRYGQLGNTLGNGTANAYPTPVQLPGTYAQVAAGFNHCLALSATGTLYTWGSNMGGTLGYATNLGTSFANPTPTPVAGSYTAIAAGLNHSLALRVDGSLWAWGLNDYGQLGQLAGAGTTTPSATPQQVPGTYVRVAAGGAHNLALKADGSLWAWGDNRYGQLGAAATSGRAAPNPTPTQVPGTYVQVAAGSQHSLSLQANGQLLAWGMNFYGQLGTGSTTGISTPSPTPAFAGTALPTRSTAGGSNFGLAIKADGTLWAWGNNEYGQLGTGNGISQLRPTKVGTDTDWVQVVAGSLHALARKANGTVWAWGYNADGQLGLGTTATQYAPAQVAVPPLVSLAAGDWHSLGLMATGQPYAWGQNTSGQLGASTPLGVSVLVPTALPGSLEFASIAAGEGHSLALKGTGLLYVWGSNQYGQRGDGFAAILNAPAPSNSALPFVQVAAGQHHSLGRTASGQVYAWGRAANGQTGPATGPTTPAATLVAGLPLATQLAAGSTHSLALGAGGAIYTWGDNTTGQLALGTFGPAATPVPAPELTGSTAWAQLASGTKGSVSLARTASGLHFASAGLNNAGQLGDGTTTDWPRFDRLSPLVSLQPLPVLGAAGSVAFALVPNPARGQTTAVGLPATATLAVYDALGRLVRTSAGPALDVVGLPAGLYVVRATVPDQPPRTARLVVE